VFPCWTFRDALERPDQSGGHFADYAKRKARGTTAAARCGYAATFAAGAAGVNASLSVNCSQLPPRAAAGWGPAAELQEVQSAAGGAPVKIADPPFVDAGAPIRDEAKAALADAIQALQTAGDRAAGAVRAATGAAPETPGFWSQVGSGVEQVAGAAVSGVAYWPEAGDNRVVVPAVNGLADLAQAIAHDSADALQTVGGLALMGVGLGAEGGGFIRQAGNENAQVMHRTGNNSEGLGSEISNRVRPPKNKSATGQDPRMDTSDWNRKNLLHRTRGDPRVQSLC
jgi:hypothetical protein